VVFAAVCFATTGTSQELGPDNLSALGVATLRTIIGAAFLLIVAAAMRNKQPRTTVQPVALSLWLAAGFGMALFAAAFFAGVRSTGIAIGTVFALASAPLFTGAISVVVQKVQPTRQWLIATLVAIIGMSILVLAGNDAQLNVGGIGLALLAGFGYALFAVASKYLVASGMPSEQSMAKVFSIAAVMLAPSLFFVDLDWLTQTRGVVLVVWLGIVSVGLAYWAYATGLRTLAPSETTMLTLVEPVVATVLGAVILDHRPTAWAWFGIVVVIGALVYESRTSQKNVRH
jgi:DME family drug/metabolite transporter